MMMGLRDRDTSIAVGISQLELHFHVVIAPPLILVPLLWDIFGENQRIMSALMCAHSNGQINHEWDEIADFIPLHHTTNV